MRQRCVSSAALANYGCRDSPMILTALFDGAFDLAAVARHVGRDLDERQRGAQLALGLGVMPGLVQRDGVVVVVLLLALADRAGFLERAYGGGEVARAIRSLGRAERLCMRELRRVDDRLV